MTPIRCLIRTAWPSRAVLVISTTILAGIVGVGARDADLGRLLIGLGVLPSFAAMLGAALGQGEHAGWAWALARPVSRRRWCLTHVTLDALTIVLAHRIAWWILPSSIGTFMGRWLIEPELLALPLSMMVYVATAQGTLRGLNAVRGVLSQLPAIFSVAIAAVSLFLLGQWVDSTGVHPGVYAMSEGASAWKAAEWVSKACALAAVVTGAAAHRLVASLAAIPQRLQRRRAVRVSAVWVFTVVPTVWIAFSPRVLLLVGPTVWARGDATIVAEVSAYGAEIRLVDGLGFGRRPQWYDIGTAYIGEVEAGDYELCRAATLGRNEGPRHVQYGALRTCADVRVAPGETVVVPTSAFDQPVFTAARLSAWFLYPGIASTLDAR